MPPQHRIKKTKIISTLGPKSSSKETVLKLIQAGVDVFRINLAHGSYASNSQIVEHYREACKEAGKNCALLMDTKGPEIRTGPLRPELGEAVQIEAGQEFTFYSSFLLGDKTKISLTFWEFTQIIKPGDRIFYNYGAIGFTVKQVDKLWVKTIVENSGLLKANKTIDLLGHLLDLPFLSYQDTKDIHFALENGTDFLALSKVSTPENVLEIRQLPGVAESGVKLFTKVECVECIANFDDILAVSDGIVICRSDIAVEVAIEKVASVQKLIIRKCNLAGKPVIVTNQILNSMEHNPRPTRAEATDVANILLDGADCCALTNSTADGKFPGETVKTIENIYLEIEPQIPYRQLYKSLRKPERGAGATITIEESVASSAVKTCWDLEASLIICFTHSGSTARFLSKYKPHAPILALTSSPKTAKQLMISRAVIPLLCEELHDDVEALTSKAIDYAKTLKIVKTGEKVITLTGHSSNEMRVMEVN